MCKQNHPNQTILEINNQRTHRHNVLLTNETFNKRREISWSCALTTMSWQLSPRYRPRWCKQPCCMSWSACPLREMTTALSLWIIHLYIELYKSILASTRHSAYLQVKHNFFPPERGIQLPSVILMIVVVGVLKVWPRFKQGLMEFPCFGFVHAQSCDAFWF